MTEAAAPPVRFFVAGVQKGGTTALDSMLRRHPMIRMARGKEVHHFDDETIDWGSPDHGRLHAAFDGPGGPVWGEATPITTYWPRALERLHAYNPAAKLVVALRRPTFRAFSQWRMETTRGWDNMPFEQAVGPEGRARVRSAPGGVHRVFSYVERGLYAPQVERVLRLFGRGQALFFRTDQLWLEPGRVLDAVQDHVGVARSLLPRREYIVVPASAQLGPIPPAAQAALNATFAADILRTAVLTGLDLSDWLRPDYREPMRAA